MYNVFNFNAKMKAMLMKPTKENCLKLRRSRKLNSLWKWLYFVYFTHFCNLQPFRKWIDNEKYSYTKRIWWTHGVRARTWETFYIIISCREWLKISRRRFEGIKVVLKGKLSMERGRGDLWRQRGLNEEEDSVSIRTRE